MSLLLEQVVVELAKRIKQVTTLSTKKVNRISKYDESGIYVETESSRSKYEIGEKNTPFDYIKYDYLLDGWGEFFQERHVTADDFKKVRGRSSFIMSLFSHLPFVEISSKEKKTSIRLREFLTDELPNVPYHQLTSFLEELANGSYETSELSQRLEKQLYRVKTRERQDARLLGFVDEFNNPNRSILESFMQAENKAYFLSRILLNHGYFHVALFCLELLKNYSKKEKRTALEELGMLVVRNSKGSNLMVESVAKDRTYHLLMWLENTQLIDNDWSPTENHFEILDKKEQQMNSNIKHNLLRILNEYIKAKSEPFGGHSLGIYVRQNIPKELFQLPFINTSEYVVTASVGQGNWAAVPWIAVMNRKITNSTQRGYYIVYLFSEDMSRVYLTLAQGVTETSADEMLRIKQEIRESIPATSKVQKDDNILLGDSKKARDYANSTAAYVMYERKNLPEEAELVSDLEEMVEIYENYIQIKNGSGTIEYQPPVHTMNVSDQASVNLTYKELVTHIHNYITSKGFLYSKEEVTNLFLSLKTKPFVILSGISGTGKTKMVQWFAESVGANQPNGQFTLIPIRPDWNDGSDLLGYRDIKGEFKEGPLTKVIKRATDNPTLPYFVLLDEMNLARVEYYFSDLLSVMESRKWEDGQIVSSYLLTEEADGFNLRLPNNLYIIGTVNMDETTHPFSKKVLDRANTIEFNDVNLKNLSFLEELETVEPISLSQEKLASLYLHLKDVYTIHKDIVEQTTEELVKINEALKAVHAHVGYRVRDEICFYLAYNAVGDLLPFNEALDYCILQKILPRISGSDVRVDQMLRELYTIFTNRAYDDNQQDVTGDYQTALYPHSAEKVAEMLRRLRDDGFTSFWVS